MKYVFAVTSYFFLSLAIAATIPATEMVSAEGFGVNEDEAVACADSQWGAEVVLEGECLSLAGYEPFAISDVVHGECTCTFDDLQKSYTCENLSTATCHY